MDVNLEEVDKQFLHKDDWRECFPIQMHYNEHIALLDGRGVIVEFGHKHLHFCDNMGMTLLLAKGRSGTFSMLRICRRVACLLLATDCFLAVRWIPSELNMADGPSRRWERLRA